MRKCILFCFLLLLGVGVILQTPIAKEKLRGWIEKKTRGVLTVGRVEGLIPFWLRFHDVRYHSESVDAEIDEVSLIVSPTSFLLGKLSILKMHASQITIQTQDKSPSNGIDWPTTPLPISIHSMTLDTLTFNRFKEISVKGMGEISKDFSFQLTIAYEAYRFRLNLDGDEEKQRMGLIAQIQQNDKLNVWTTGVYDWGDAKFLGELYGEAYALNLKSTFAFSDSLFTISELHADKELFSIEGEGSYDLSTGLLHSDGSFLERPYAINGNVDWTKEELDFSNLDIHYAGNTLTGSLTYDLDTETAVGALDLELTDLSPYSIEYPIGGTGRGHLCLKQDLMTFTLIGEEVQWKDLTCAELALEGEFKEGALTFQVSVQDFVVLDPAYEVFPTAHLNVSGVATHDQLNLNGELLGMGSAPFILSAQIPIRYSPHPIDFTIDHNSPFAIDLKGEGSIDPILAFLENASLIAQGAVNIDLSLQGTWDNPEITGSLIYENGRVESLATGALYRDIHMVLEGEGRALKIRSMSAHDLNQGDLSGNGQIVWNPKEGFPFEFNIATHHFTLVAIDPLTTNVDAQLSITGNIHEMGITGDATIVEGHLAIPNQMPTQIPTLDVIYINCLPSPKPEIEEDAKRIPIYWDVQIAIPKKLTIDGRGLLSEWRGHLHMYGFQDDLLYSGKLKLVQGRFTLIGRTFDLVEGKILIHGLDPKDIIVDLKGDLELATITASLILSGHLDATQVAFISNPPMSTNQILSWILFNQDVNELTPFQAVRLANALVQLSGKYAGPSVWNNIKEGLGIDVFDITNCDFDSADFTFQVGKYISQGTFVGVSKSFSGDFDSVLIQTRLYRNFYLEGDYGGSLNGLTPNGGKLIFKWYRTY